MKIKYIAGKQKDKVVEIDDAQAKSLIEDGLAEAVVEEIDPIETAMKGLDVKIAEAATKAADAAAKSVLDKVSKGIGNVSPRISVGVDNATLDKSGGFKSASHFYTEVMQSAKTATKAMQHWSETHAKATGMNETTSGDGGYAIPVEYASNIFKPWSQGPNFRSMIFETPMQSSTINIPVEKYYNRANTTVTAGVVSFVTTSDGASLTTSKDQWEQLSLTLAKISVVVPVTNELLDDNNVALGTVVNEAAGRRIRFQENKGILQGNSAYSGIIGNAASKISKRGTVNTISFTDVLNMFANFAHDDCDFNSSVWFAHPTTIPQIGTMTVTSTGQAIYFPPGGAANGSVGMLMGRPLIVTGLAKPLGTAGDLILADMSKYVGGAKGGLNSMISPHVYFLTDEQAFRFTERVTGKPGLSGVITLEDSSTTVSPFVTLGTDSSGLS